MTLYDRKKINFLKAYLMFVVVAAVAGLGVGAVQAAVLGFALTAFGVPMATISRVTEITGAIFGLMIGFFVFRWTIRTYILSQVRNDPRVKTVSP